MPAQTVREFVFQSYRLINSSNPTVPLHGDDEKLAIQVMNQLLEYYASNGLLITIAKTVTTPVNLGTQFVDFTDSDYIPIQSQTVTATLTTGLSTFAVLNGSLYSSGDSIVGNGVPSNTTILNIVNNTVTMSANSTFTGASVLTITHSITDSNIVYINEGRLANLDSAWLVLSGVTYPLILKSRDEFLAAWKYEPLKGLPRFLITFPDTEVVRTQLYPAPSQFYDFFARGKFQLPFLTSNDDMSLVPLYYQRFLLFAVAKDVAMYKGRADSWTQKLEDMYMQARDVMESASEVNLAVVGDEQSLLNGAWRVRAGI